MLYFKLEYQYSIAQKATFWEKIIDRLLSHFVPMANPTLEENLGYVKEWYLEYDDVEEYVNREVGLAENGLVVFKTPFEENWGYWCDSKIRGHAVSSNDMPLLLYSSFTISQSKTPLPSSSSSMPKPTTSRLSALKGSRYWRS